MKEPNFTVRWEDCSVPPQFNAVVAEAMHAFSVDMNDRLARGDWRFVGPSLPYGLPPQTVDVLNRRCVDAVAILCRRSLAAHGRKYRGLKVTLDGQDVRFR